jgi:hypothetical protein
MKNIKNLPMYIDSRTLKEHFVSWSKETLKRRIENDGFPAFKDEGGQYLFPTKDVVDWFKRRESKAG